MRADEIHKPKQPQRLLGEPKRPLGPRPERPLGPRPKQPLGPRPKQPLGWRPKRPVNHLGPKPRRGPKQPPLVVRLLVAVQLRLVAVQRCKRPKQPLLT